MSGMQAEILCPGCALPGSIVDTYSLTCAGPVVTNDGVIFATNDFSVTSSGCSAGNCYNGAPWWPPADPCPGSAISRGRTLAELVACDQRRYWLQVRSVVTGSCAIQSKVIQWTGSVCASAPCLTCGHVESALLKALALSTRRVYPN